MSKLEENMSALMDGQADDLTMARLLSDDKLKGKWQNYHLIRDTLKGDIPKTIYPDLSTVLSERLIEEDSFSHGDLITNNGWKHTARRMIGMAIAASVALGIFIGVNGLDDNSRVAPLAEHVISSPSDELQVPTVANTVAITDSTADMTEEERQRLASYLEKHTTQSVKKKLDTQPYVRVVNYKFDSK